MQVVGVDFGTTNIRISVWDPEQDDTPETKRLGIGIQREYPMPAVVALQQGADGEVSILVGEDAQLLQDVESDAILVIDNIKRYAMSPDAYVQGRVKERSKEDLLESWPPPWWDEETRRVREFGREFPVWDLIKELLTEAFLRANIQGDYEWRAGCPVHTNLEYRAALADTLSQVTGVGGSINWIVEEPLLFLNSVLQLPSREIKEILGEEGAYLVYDIGGGSFDCALVEVSPMDPVRIYGADGHPALGGSVIDHQLRKNLGYQGAAYLLRQAKESLTPASRAFPMQGGVILTGEDVGSALKGIKFLEQSVSVLRDSYVGAKMLWKRGEGEDDPPVGEILHKTRDGEVTFVWQTRWEDLAKDVNGIILVGGTSKSYFVIPGAESFKEYLENSFPDTRVISEDTVEALKNLEIAITGASKGACYAAGSRLNPAESGHNTPLYVNRLPVYITLEDRQTGDTVEYRPYEYLGTRDALTWVTIEDLQSGKKAKYDTYSRFAFREGNIFDPFASKDSPVRATLKYSSNEGVSEHQLDERLGAAGASVRVTLTDVQTEGKVSYVLSPSQKNPSAPFAPQDALLQLTLEEIHTERKATYASGPMPNPFDVFVSSRSLTEQDNDPHSEGRYELTVTTPDGLLMKTADPNGDERERQPVGKPYANNKPTINTRLIGSSLRLAIDRLGRVGVEQRSDQSSPKRYMVIENPPWQTTQQKQAIQTLLEQERKYQERERERLQETLTRNPWRWQEHPG